MSRFAQQRMPSSLTFCTSLALVIAMFVITSVPSTVQAATMQQAATPTVAANTTPPQTGAASTSTESIMQRVRQRNATLVAGVAYDLPPFGFLDEQGEVTGFDIDLIKALTKIWGVNVEFVQVTAANRAQTLAAGQVDLVAASMTHKQEREELIDFSQTYFMDGQSLLVRRYAGILGIQDLNGKTVAAVQGSNAIEQVQAYAAANQIDISVLPFQEYTTALAALKAGQVDALTAGSVSLLAAVQADQSLAVVGGRFTREPYGIGIPTGDSYFRNLVDYTLQQLKQSGEYDKIYRSWFDDDLPYPIDITPGTWPYTFATSPITLTVPAPSTFDRIKQRQQLVVGVKHDQPPFGFIDEQGQVTGFDVDIAREFARRWLGNRNALLPVQVTSSSRIPVLASGDVDMLIAAMPHAWEDETTIDFSEAYLIDGQRLLVRTFSGITDMAGLEGKTVAIIQGSANEEPLRQLANELAIEIEVLPFQEYSLAVEALKAGQVDAVTADELTLLEFVRQNPELAVVGDRLTTKPQAIGVPQFDSTLRDAVNITLQAMKADGTYDTLFKKWFGDTVPYPVEIWPSGNNLILDDANDPNTNSTTNNATTEQATGNVSASANVTATNVVNAAQAVTATRSLTPTVAATAKQAPTATAKPTNTATTRPVTVGAATAKPSPTATLTNTATTTDTPTQKPTATQTNTPKPTLTATATKTDTAEPTDTATSKPTATLTQTPKPTVTATASNTPEPTDTATPKPTATATSAPEPTHTATLNPTATATNTPKPTGTPTAKPTVTATATSVPAPTVTPTPEPTDTATPKPTATATNTNTPEPTDTATPKPTATATNTNTPEPTDTATPKPTATATNTSTPAPTDTATPKPTATATNTNTPAPTDTATPKPTATATNTYTPEPTDTATAKPTATATNTSTPAPTATNTPEPTNTATPKPAPTATNTATPVPFPTVTPTPEQATPAQAAPEQASPEQQIAAPGVQSYGYAIVPDGYRVNIRNSASILAEVIGSAEPGTLLPVLARNPESAWVQILWQDGRIAWVNAEVVIISPIVLGRLPFVEPPPIPEALPTTPTEGSQTGDSTVNPVEATPTPTPAPVNEGLPKTYVVQRGDNLWFLADRLYGYGNYWTQIYEANKATIGSDPTRLAVGQTLYIPVLLISSSRT